MGLTTAEDSGTEGLPISAITDGTSNSISAGESQGFVTNGRREIAWAYLQSRPIAINTAWDHRGPGFVSSSAYLNPLRQGDETYYSFEQFSSPHTSVVLFSFADGAVHQLSRDTANEILDALSSRASGDTIGDF